MLERDGRNHLYVTLCNYEDGSLETSRQMMQHPGAVLAWVTAVRTAGRSATAATRPSC
jgi:hypothetical protein